MRNALLPRKPLIWGGGGLLLLIIILTALKRNGDEGGAKGPDHCRDSLGFVSEKTFGEKWPLTVQEGCVQCIGHVAVVFNAEGKSYALNSNAVARNYPPIDEIVKPGYSPSQREAALEPIIRQALKRCEE